MENKVRNFGLLQGISAETSGGLLCAVDNKHVSEFLENSGGWIVGKVIKGNRKAEIK